MKDKQKWFKECKQILCNTYRYDEQSANDLAASFDDEQIEENTPIAMLQEEFSVYDGRL